MSFAPRQDWSAYRALVSTHEQRHVRGLTIAQKFLLYEDLYRLVVDPRYDSTRVKRLDQQRWEQKLRLRRKLIGIYSAADRQNRG